MEVIGAKAAWDMTREVAMEYDARLELVGDWYEHQASMESS